jgi:hypothetical protein
MSNWRVCIPANPQYENATNSFCIMSTNIVPTVSVSCKVQVQYQNGSLAIEFVNITGNEYKEWGFDDEWLYLKIALKLVLGTLVALPVP